MTFIDKYESARLSPVYVILMVVIFVMLLLVGCANQEGTQGDKSQKKTKNPLDAALNEKINYSWYSADDFSILYPEWPDTAEGNVELAVSRGYCTVAVNSEKLPAKQWFKMLVDSVEKQSGDIFSRDEDNNQLKYSLNYKNITFISDNRIFECNSNSVAVTLTCIEPVSGLLQNLSSIIFPSAECREKEIEFSDFEDMDFSVSYPGWDDLNDDGGEQRMLGKTKGTCSLIVDKHNALPKDIAGWMEKAISEKDGQKLLSSSAVNDEYDISYKLSYNENPLTAETKIFYCNYQSYIVQVLCMDEFASEADLQIRDAILESAGCARTYEVPTPKIVEEKKEELKEEEPEVIEEIEDDIVRTDAGAEFGIDEEMVVYFINSNAFFTKVMKDFPRANIVIEDKDNSRELKLRVRIDNSGKITRLEDGEYDNADVTLIVPLRDALNIFSNAANINPLTLLGFAANVRTEPANIKNQVIQKVLRGEYN
jgi:hypothetical protein